MQYFLVDISSRCDKAVKSFVTALRALHMDFNISFSLTKFLTISQPKMPRLLGNFSASGLYHEGRFLMNILSSRAASKVLEV